MPHLRDFLESTFAEYGGLMPFEKFMELALYDPEFGYYTRNIDSVGGRMADFATTNTLSESSGRAIAEWVCGLKRNSAGNQTIIEAGAGDGSLARTILKSLGFRRRRHTNYRIVEISPKLQVRQRQTLKKFDSRIDWFDSMEEAVAGVAEPVIFSNELVDAFPVRMVRWNGCSEEWEEIWVRFDPAGGISEEFRSYSGDIEITGPPVANQRVEIHELYRTWLESWMPGLKAGTILTIDYGGTIEEIYRRRPGGTLRGYYRHERMIGAQIYQRFGKQDLTADVNFDDLIQWGREFGFQPASYETQAEFLQRFGRLESAGILSEALSAFRVLIQVK
ncbi:MAG: hypothetical protein HKN23_15935 [Verrucomicrobiales bacterium]|nr:hypothetical protein [Verrucomicrobiales bacterium]